MRQVALNPLRPGQPVGFSLLRVPFFLEPNYSRSEDFEETNRTRLERKWGGKREFAAQKHRHQLKERGLEVGIKHFNLDRLASSTFASHRLVQWASKHHGITVAEVLYDELNYRHFEKGLKLNDSKMLADTAAHAGIERAAAEAFLATDQGMEEIDAALSILSRLGVSSIPTFVLGASRVVGGAMPAEELTRHLRELEAQPEGAPDTVFGAALGSPSSVLEQTIDLDRYANAEWAATA